MKTNQELIKELRALTQAGMKDCKDALETNDWDLNKAIDAVKAKGLQNTTSREGRLASEGVVKIIHFGGEESSAVMVEVNCQTDFVARNPDFLNFAEQVADTLCSAISCGDLDFTAPFNIDNLMIDGDTNLGSIRKELIALTRENVQVRRWWAQEVTGNNRVVTGYTHSNNKLGVLVSLEAPDVSHPAFKEFADGVAMQIAAMNPLSVSRTHVSQADVDRQKAIFETQLTEANKPQAAWPKILDGKFNKWYSEVCLLDQESVMVPKVTVGFLADKLSKEVFGDVGKVKVLSFIRCQVGEGIEKKEEDFASEVAKLSGVEQPGANIYLDPNATRPM